MINIRRGWLLAETAAIITLYVATAKIGFLSSIPPGNVTIIWPPSGIAVAAILLSGYRAGIGVWLGSFIVNYWFLHNGTANATAIIISAAIALGSTFQDALVAYLIQKRYGPAVFVGHYGRFFVFAIIAMLCCVIAATAGAATLLISNMISNQAFPSTWGAWWLGDFLGIIIITPIAQVAVHHIQHKYEPSHAAALTLSCGIGFSVLVFITVWNLENQKIAEQFRAISQTHMSALQEIISLSHRDLSWIISLYHASHDVTRQEFHAFVQTRSDSDFSEGVQAIEWAPRVSHDKRESFEKSVQHEGLKDFRIMEHNTDDMLVSASNRAEYFPVTFIEPQAGNELALGFDLASNSSRKHALDLARDSADYVATEPVTLVQKNAARKGVLIVKAVYQNTARVSSVAERRDSLAGFALAVFDIGDLVEASIEHLMPMGLNVYLFDRSSESGEQLLYAHSSRLQQNSDVGYEEDSSVKLQQDLHYTDEIDFDGRTWRVVIKPIFNFVADRRSGAPWYSLLGGLSLSLLIYLYEINRIRAQKILDEKQIQLNERVKEQRCLHAIFKLTEDLERPVDELLHRLVEFIPPGWFYPEITAAKLEYGAMAVATPNFTETQWTQAAEAITKQGERVRLTVAYLEEKPSQHEGPFSREERILIDTIVARVTETADRRYGESILRESQERLLKIIAAAQDAIIMMDSQGCINLWNQGAERIFGYSETEARGKDLYQLLMPERFHEAFRANFPKFIQSGDGAAVGRINELVAIHKDGSEFPVELSLAALQSADTWNAVGILRDITERNKMDAALRDSEKRYRRLFESANDALMILEGPTWRFVSVNPSCVRVFGASEEAALLSITPWQLSPERQPDGQLSEIKAQEIIVQAIKEGSHAFEWIHQRVTGELFTAEVNLVYQAQDDQAILQATLRDVTERRQIEAELLKSEQDLKQAQHVAKVGSWELDIPNNQLGWSDEIYRIFEIDPAQFGASYDAFLAAIHPDDRDTINQAYNNSLATRQPYSIRHRLIMADGRIKYVHEQCQTDFDADGNPLRSIGTVQDITDQVQIETALQESRDLLQTVIDHAPLRVFWKDKDLRYLGCNPAFAEDAGHNQPSELVGQDDYQMCWAHEADLYRADDRAIIESGIARVNFEEPQTTPDGQLIWLKTSKVPLRKGNGEIIGVLGIYQDITEEKKKDEELTEYREHLEKLVQERSAQLAEAQLKYQRLLDDMGDEFLAFSFTPDTRITYVGNGTEAIFGLPKARILGQFWAESIPWLPEDLQATQLAVHDLLAGKVDSIRTEMRFIHPDGQIHAIYQTSHSIKNDSGTIVAVDGVLMDITLRKRHQTELIEAKLAAEAANRAKSAFLANMSHEIRTPMNGVIGMLEILSHSDLQKDELKMVETIRRSARSLLGIIDDILDFSKIEAGKLSLVEREISLEAELDMVIGMIDRIAMDKQVDLTMFFEPTLPLHVLGDGLRLRQILTNLAGNAVKFSSDMERIGRVQVRAELEGYEKGFAMVAFTIADNGIGMDADTVARLFRPFEQADDSTTRKYGGTGLGLAISRNLTTMLGGKVTVQSEPGQGTTFTVHMPFKIASECPNTTSPYDLSELECILVVSEPTFLDDFTRYLTHAGAHTHAFADLEGAWAFIADHPASSPVCVIIMEDSGIHSARDIVEHLLSLQPGNHVHFVEVTYLSLERGKRRKLRRLADRVVQIDREALTRQSFLMAAAAVVGRVEIPHEPEFDARITASTDPLYHILVAEDNELNRDVIQRQLTMLGYRAELANDGQVAYQKWETDHYDLLLTDLHMPNTDGYELTGLIRGTEARHNLTRLPIIALTANAMKGEKEYCLQHGMDAYLSKPIELERLKFVLDQWLTSSASSERAVAKDINVAMPKAEDSDLPVFDSEVLTKLLGDKPAIHRRLLEKFLNDTQGHVSQLLQACDTQNAVLVHQAAHSLKSVSRSMGAMRLGILFEQLEHAGRAGNGKQCLSLGRQLNAAFNEAERVIRAYLETL